MIKKLTVTVLAYLLATTSVMANTTATEASLKTILKKHEYKLTVHPQAHEESFKAKALKELKEELSKFTSTNTKEDLKKQFQEVVAEIPSAEKRAEYVKLLENSSKNELNNLLANPTLLSDAMRGEGSNFTGDGRITADEIFLSLGIALVIWLVVEAIEDAAKYDRFYSYTVSYTIYTYSHSSSCSSYDLEGWEKADIKEDALYKCQRYADKPSTCRFSYYDVDTYTDAYNEHRKHCDVRAVYKAEKN